MGGKTTSSTGEVDAQEGEMSAGKERGVQGYGGEKDMDREIGA
jgi:hypothetical protein